MIDINYSFVMPSIYETLTSLQTCLTLSPVYNHYLGPSLPPGVL